MIKFFIILRKLFLALAPLALLYFLRKKEEKTAKRKSSLSGFDKSKIVEGEIVKEKK